MTRGRVTGPDGSAKDLGELHLELECPCGQPVTVFERGILHMEPQCRFFQAYEPLDYLRWVRKSKERKLGAP